MRQRQEEAERAEALAAAEAVLTGGVRCSIALRGVTDTSGAEDDKVVLPQSVFDTLNTQDAFSRGVMYFRLTAVGSGRVTHAGVREFTAKEGEVVLPQKVFDSLSPPSDPSLPGQGHTRDTSSSSSSSFEESSQPSASLGTNPSFPGYIEVKYVRLPKINYVKFQPFEHSFYDIENVKLMLEDNLRRHSALTVGDVVTVWFRGKKYTLQTVEVRPDRQGSLIDTDVEIDLEESAEYKASLLRKRQQEAEASRGNGGRLLDVGSAVVPPQPAASAISAVPTGRALGRPSNAEIPPQSTASAWTSASFTGPALSAASLTPEPPLGSEGAITCKFRVPSIGGGSLTRRFLQSDPAEMLFAFLRSHPGLASQLSSSARSLQLTTRFPNRTIAESEVCANPSLTLASLGVTSSMDFIVSVV
jgi:hypothetical protein